MECVVIGGKGEGLSIKVSLLCLPLFHESVPSESLKEKKLKVNFWPLK